MFNLFMNTITYLLYGHFHDVVLRVGMQIFNEIIEYTQQVKIKEMASNVAFKIICLSIIMTTMYILIDKLIDK